MFYVGGEGWQKFHFLFFMYPRESLLAHTHTWTIKDVFCFLYGAFVQCFFPEVAEIAKKEKESGRSETHSIFSLSSFIHIIVDVAVVVVIVL